jgi:hypothetical protein
MEDEYVEVEVPTELLEQVINKAIKEFITE